MHAFSLRSYFLGEKLRRQSSRRALKEFGSGGEHCFCIGTGPSLDCVDLDQVRNSTVLLLNGAFHRLAEFQGNNNKLFWFAFDTRVVSEMISSVPQSLTKIITINRFSGIESFHAHFRPGRDVFLQPKPILRDPAVADPERNSHYSIWPSLFTDLDPSTYHWDVHQKFHVGVKSVAFSAIFFALHFQFRRIIALGMDLPSNKVIHPHAEYCGESLQGKGFGSVARDQALKQLVAMAELREVMLINASPLAETDIIPKRDDIASALQ